MPYGDFVGKIQYDTPATQVAPLPVTAEDAPATTAAQGQFGLYTLGSAVIGFWIPAAWVGTAIFALVWLLAGSVVAPMEASAKAKAKDHGGGGGDVAVIGVILLVVVAAGFLFFAGLARAGGVGVKYW